MRHGIALERYDWDGPDHTRPLSEPGMDRTRAVAEALQEKKLMTIDAIWTSPYVRARQTAEIVATVFEVPITECEALACGAAFSGLRKVFQKNNPPERILLTGHEPDMGELLHGLTGHEWEPFKKAAVAYMSGPFAPDGMSYKWFLKPKEILGE